MDDISLYIDYIIVSSFCTPVSSFSLPLQNITQHTSAWKRILYNLAVEFTACVRFKSEKRQSGSNFSLKWWNTQGLPIMMTEYGADTVAGLRDSMPVMFTEEYQVAYYKMYHEVFDTLDHFIGEHAWNFADFATCQAISRVQGNKKGIFTRDRRPKMAAHYFKQRWENIPDFDYK